MISHRGTEDTEKTMKTRFSDSVISVSRWRKKR